MLSAHRSKLSRTFIGQVTERRSVGQWYLNVLGADPNISNIRCWPQLVKVSALIKTLY